MYGIKKQKLPVDIKYDEPQVIINPNPDLQAGFQQMSFVKTNEGLQSSNFATGSAGWKITNTGNAEFNSISLYSNSTNAIIVDYGSDILLKEGGDVKFTTVDAPTACTVALITTAGNVDAGTHYYAVTYVNDSGETELGTASNTVTNDATNQQNALTSIPTSPSGSVISRNIYRTKAGGADYYLLATIADNSTTTYTDNIADVSLTGGVANSNGNTSYGKIKVDNITVLSSDKSITVVGAYAGQSNTQGYANTFLGNYSGRYNTQGYWNTFVGYYSGINNTTGSGNTFIGQASGTSNTIGVSNTFIGSASGIGNTSGSDNIFIGINTGLSNTTGSSNIFFGNGAGTNNISNTGCLFIGNSAGENSTSDYNTFIGNYSGRTNTIGVNNTFVGYQSGNSNTTGFSNTLNGYQSMYYNTTGYFNIAIGLRAGMFISGGITANQTSNTSIYLGLNTKALADGGANEIIIGYNTTGAGSNTVTLGNTSITKTILRGTVSTSGYTVATLPTGVVGMRAYVTDATTPTYLGALTGGGAVTCPVFFDGTAWVSA